MRTQSRFRGFTLLEVTLATAIGGMVILVSLSLLVSMEKLERPLATRQQELAELYRTRMVIQRALSSLVVSDTTAPINPNARRTASSTTSASSSSSSTSVDSGSDEKGKSAFEATAEATASKQQQQQRPPARLLLEADQTDELKSALQLVGVPTDSASSIQRLEVVVDSPPIAPNFRADLGDAIAATYARNASGAASSSSSSSSSSGKSSGSSSGSGSGSVSYGASQTSSSRLGSKGQSGSSASASRGRRNLKLGGAAGDSAAPTGSLRGAFEIRPMQSAENQLDRRAGKPVLYQLWWMPLPSAKDTSKQNAATNAPPVTKEDDPRTLESWGEPVLLANNLVKCRWKLFSSGEQRNAHNAVWERELPAYVEFEVQTKTGLYENWMFEIGWTKGAELATRESTAGEGGPGDLGGPGGVGQNSGPRNGQQGPNGASPQGPIQGGFNIPPQQGGGTGPHYDTIPTKPPK